MLGGDFAAISKLGDHFAVISKLKIDFAAHFIAISLLKSDFAAQSFKMRRTVLQNGTRVPKLVSQLRNTLPNGVSAAKFSLSFARLSSNDHNFFISNPNHIPFEALDS
ncbi:hypothetical protein VitviT2T_029785 [Vitis vinifera]|uniref:Uncharacterized protein n=1 Tax=Vitis vinifera TaxID=29760 RepID=A0ABY9DXH3_VITVI|nr:hypothetical protein VitviT2T_029785 [Vitis vinifera]